MSNGYSFGSSGSQSSSGTQVVPGMLDVYNQLLGMNQGVYGNVLSAYQNGQASLTSQLPGLYQGYDQLAAQNRDILGLSGGGWGVAQPAATEIGRTFSQRRGAADQQLISSGLGNSTVRANLGQSFAREQANAYGALGSQLASTAAGQQMQIGLARQNAYQQGLGMQNQLSAGLGNALAGRTFANTAGGLTGSYSNSSNQSSQQSVGGSGGGGGGYGGRGDLSGPTGTEGRSAFGLFGGTSANPYGQAGQGMGYSGGYAYGGGGYGGYGGGSGTPAPAGGGWDGGVRLYPNGMTAAGDYGFGSSEDYTPEGYWDENPYF